MANQRRCSGSTCLLLRFSGCEFRLSLYTPAMRTKVIAALLVASFVIGGGFVALLGLWMGGHSPAPKVGGSPAVIQQIQSLSELVTVKFVLQKIVTFTNASTTTISQLPGVLNLPGFEEDRITLVAHGIVKAGVDLSKLKPEDVRASADTITVRVPRAVVTDAYLDESQTQVLDRKTGLFRSFESTLEQQARQYARVEMARAARQAGIEGEADQRARDQLMRLLQSLGFKRVEFENTK
jgi:hypothetical protein